VSFSLATAYGFALLLFRVTALCSTAPILGARVVPARIRLGISVAVAFAVFTGVGSPAVAPPAGLGGLAAAAASETLCGLLAGLAARFTLDAALGAGHLAGLSAGLGFSALIDPSTGAESTAVSQTLFTTAQGVAVAMGVHREAIAWLARSVVTYPLGAPIDLAALSVRTIGLTAVSIALAVRLAFPVVGAVLLGHALMATLGRMSPQLSLGSVGFSVAILLGGLSLYLSAPTVAELAARAAVAVFQGS
jgi:flagellar biosynthetic protein FliR